MSVIWTGLETADGQPATLPDPPAVVLLHCTVPYRHVGHVAIVVGGRLHASRAWRLVRAAARAGPVRIARVWPCATEDEARAQLARVQSAGGRGRYCPVCRAGKMQA